MQSIYRIVGLASLLANGTVLTMGHARAPASPIAAAAVVAGGASATSAERRGDGLYHLAGRHDGAEVEFVVDTGATVTVLTAADAARLGAIPLADGEGAMLATAGGRTSMSWARLRSLEIGGRRLAALDVAVVQDGIGRSLLGQDVLAQLGTIVIADDRLEIRA